jgi:hypothetical protein
MAACEPVEKEFQRGTWRLKVGLAAALCAALVWMVAASGMR